ncbi:MAG: hypothetical protein IJY25_05225 [Bacilli bacterium]|nr:hypothetical protein [Bacilli bacterium]
MNKDQLKQLMTKQVLSLEEVKFVLDSLVNEIKNTMNVNDSSTRLCKESSMALWKLCSDIGLPYIPCSMSEINMSDLEHHYGITGFKTEYGQICFLLDLTYIQFTEDLYPVNVGGINGTKEVLSPGNFISEENQETLVNSGYITLTKENYDDYLRSFIETNKLVNQVNEDLIYGNAYSLLGQYHINFVEKDYINNQGISY